MVCEGRALLGTDAVGHGAEQREASVADGALDGAEDAGLDEARAVEEPLDAAEGADGTGGDVDVDRAAVGAQRHVEEELVDDGEGLGRGAEDLAVGSVALDGLAGLGEEDHLVEVALDLGMDLGTDGGVEPLDASGAERVLVRVHERVDGAVEQVVADEARGVGLAQAALARREHVKRVVQRMEQAGRARVVHELADAVAGGRERVCDEVEQRVGTLVAEKEGIEVVEGGEAEGRRHLGVGVAAEEVVGQNCGHGLSFG